MEKELNPEKNLFLSFNYEEQLLNLAVKLASAGNDPEAASILERLISLFPYSTNALYLLSNIQQRLNQPEQSIQTLEHCLEIDANYFIAYLDLVRKLLQRGEIEKAEKVLDKALSIAGEHPSLVRLYGSLLAHKGEVEGAMSMLDECLSKYEGDRENLPLMIDCINLLGEHLPENVVISLMHYGLKLEPDNLALCHAVFSWVRQHDKIELGGSYVKEICSRVTDASQALLEFADLLVEKGKTDAAADFLNTFYQSSPNAAVRKRLQQLKPPQPRIEKEVILFVSTYPRAREMKMAATLRKNNIPVVLITPTTVTYDAKPYFDEVIIETDVEKSLAIATQYRSKVCHVFSGNADSLSMAFIKEKIAPTIFDPYDLIEGLIQQPYTYDVGQIQRYCMENADALCLRDLRAQHQRRTLGYRLPEQLIYFPDYCYNSQTVADPILRGESEDIHVVACGGMVTNKHTHEQDWGYLDFGKALAAQGVHLHLYPKHHHQDDTFAHFFEDYIKFAEESPYFHMHLPIPADQMPTELRKYHFGICGAWFQIQHQIPKSYTKAAHELCLAARVMDYLEAGLPVISPTASRSIYHLLNRANVGIASNFQFFENAREILSNFVRDPALPENIKRAQEIYSIERHVPRLIRFYERLSARKSAMITMS